MAAALSGDEIDRELIKLRLLSAAWVEIINQFRKLFENDLIVSHFNKVRVLLRVKIGLLKILCFGTEANIVLEFPLHCLYMLFNSCFSWCILPCYLIPSKYILRLKMTHSGRVAWTFLLEST